MSGFLLAWNLRNLHLTESSVQAFSEIDILLQLQAMRRFFTSLWMPPHSLEFSNVAASIACNSSRLHIGMTNVGHQRHGTRVSAASETLAK